MTSCSFFLYLTYVTWHSASMFMLLQMAGASFLWLSDSPASYLSHLYSSVCWQILGSFPCFGCCEFRCVNTRACIPLPGTDFISFGCVSSSGITGPHGTSGSDLVRGLHTVFPRGRGSLRSHQQGVHESSFLHVLANTCYLGFLILAIPTGVR